MTYKFEYTDTLNRESILSANADKTLIAEHNLFEGNFLIFTDEPIEEPVNQIRIDALKQIIDLKKNYLNMDYSAEQEELRQLTGL